MEGTGSYGTGLARFLADHGVDIVEVDCPNRQLRHRQGKSDPTDAVAAARAALSGQATGRPKSRSGPVEQMRVLLVARRSARDQRIRTLNQIRFNGRIWKPAVRSADLPGGLRMHDLRHTAVAFLISQGAHPEAIKRYMGHSSIAVTMDVYGHLFPSDAEDLAAKLDAMWRDSNGQVKSRYPCDRLAPVRV